MGTYLTNYRKADEFWSGCDIEAESFCEAEEIAMSLSGLERSLPSPQFDWLHVIGEIVMEVAIDDSHAADELICVHCSGSWLAVYLMALKDIYCPYCGKPTPTE